MKATPRNKTHDIHFPPPPSYYDTALTAAPARLLNTQLPLPHPSAHTIPHSTIDTIDSVHRAVKSLVGCALACCHLLSLVACVQAWAQGPSKQVVPLGKDFGTALSPGKEVFQMWGRLGTSGFGSRGALVGKAGLETMMRRLG